jgi:hypothetical protein
VKSPGKLFAAIAVWLVLVPIAISGSFEPKLRSLQTGQSKSDVQHIMGAPNYSKSEGDLDIWQYARISGFGRCEYIRIWFWKHSVTNVSTYKRASIAGCSAGLRKVNWSLAMSEAPIIASSVTEAEVTSLTTAPVLIREPASTKASLADELGKLEQLHASGALTEAEFTRAKAKLLESD